MFVRGDLFGEGAKAFLDKRKPDWKSHGLVNPNIGLESA